MTLLGDFNVTSALRQWMRYLQMLRWLVKRNRTVRIWEEHAANAERLRRRTAARLREQEGYYWADPGEREALQRQLERRLTSLTRLRDNPWGKDNLLA